MYRIDDASVEFQTTLAKLRSTVGRLDEALIGLYWALKRDPLKFHSASPSFRVSHLFTEPPVYVFFEVDVEKNTTTLKSIVCD